LDEGLISEEEARISSLDRMIQMPSAELVQVIRTLVGALELAR